MSKRMMLLETGLKSSIARTRWLLAGGMILTSAAVASIAYLRTIASAVDLWMTRDTYTYAFAVLPIAAFLVWMRRERFRSSMPQPSYSALAAVVLFSLMWWAGARYGVDELQHIAFAGVLVSIVLCGIGWANAVHFSVPLLYLFLLAPAGTPLLPFLQDAATFLATTLLSIGQIAYYAEGHMIEVATGKYEVAPGCAGLNFILAMATVTPLYCEMMYRGWKKKLIAFSSMMLLVPVANGIRVFGIIAIAEYTHSAIDISADHLFYGWVFFSAIVVVLFWIGSFFSDSPPSLAPIMPWGGHYTLAELLADPVIIRLQYVQLAAVLLAVAMPVLVGLGVPG
jgi:exosortase